MRQILLDNKYTVTVSSQQDIKHGYYAKILFEGRIEETGSYIRFQAHREIYETKKQEIMFDIISCKVFNPRARVYGSKLVQVNT